MIQGYPFTELTIENQQYIEGLLRVQGMLKHGEETSSNKEIFVLFGKFKYNQANNQSDLSITTNQEFQPFLESKTTSGASKISIDSQIKELPSSCIMATENSRKIIVNVYFSTDHTKFIVNNQSYEDYKLLFGSIAIIQPNNAEKILSVKSVKNAQSENLTGHPNQQR